MASRFFIALTAVLLSASPTMPSGTPDSFVYLDLVRFFPQGTSTIMEGYIQISMSAIELVSGPGSGAHVDFSLTLEDTARKEVYRNSWTYEDVITAEMLSEEGKTLLQSFALLLNPGKYTLRLNVSGVKEDVAHEFERQVEAPAERPLISDILLATHIVVDTLAQKSGEATDVASSYAKDGLLLTPNPSSRFVGATSLVYFYCQIQNQDTIPSDVHVQFELIDSDEKLVKKLPDKNLKVTGKSRIFVGAFSTAGLKEGNYLLKSVAKQNSSSGGEFTSRRDKPFTVTAKRAVLASYAQVNEYGDFSEAQLDSVSRLMRYLLTGKARDTYNSLSLVGKRNFLHEFWKNRDPVPATPENEFRTEYERRLDHANTTFGMGWEANAIEGWLTDRGRIYSKFGEPNERITRPNEAGSPPWELWKYFSSGYSYLFVDRTDQELYDLVYTNDKDEPIIPGWERQFPERVLEDIYTEFGYAR
jgi:GWxTD domain-containing protein